MSVPKVPSSINGDERQPLLVPSSEIGIIDQQNITTDDPEDQRKVEGSDELGWKSYTFYGILLVIGLGALTLLIKGFIDAGDTEVRNPNQKKKRQTLFDDLFFFTLVFF